MSLVEIEEKQLKKMLVHFQTGCLNIIQCLECENIAKAAFNVGLLISSINHEIYDYDLQDINEIEENDDDND